MTGLELICGALLGLFIGGSLGFAWASAHYRRVLLRLAEELRQQNYALARTLDPFGLDPRE